ncbi:MAG: hypothetical protein HYX47_07485 [Burkholderiales bacterium]|nr:hypothetical protein [Burkholderiales bacterium]
MLETSWACNGNRHAMKQLWTLARFALVAALPAAALAQADIVVGTATLEMHDKAHGRKFTSELWFEAAPGAAVQGFAVRAPLRAIDIARNAEPAPRRPKRPLIVVSHGNWGTRYSQGWLSTRLVNAGYVVLSTSHPGTLGDDQSAAGRLRLWDRSRDASFALTEVLSDPKWSAFIDEKRIGFAGHSFGGWTGVSLAGGKFDPAVQREACRKSPKKDVYCDGMLKDDTKGIAAADAAESFNDSRFKAFYIMASGPAAGFSADSLRSIAVPFLIDTAAYDEILDPAANSGALARLIPGAQEIVRPAGHFAYVPECKWLVGPLLARVAGTPICDDPSGTDRGRIHTQAAEGAIRFFSQQLKTGEAAPAN